MSVGPLNTTLLRIYCCDLTSVVFKSVDIILANCPIAKDELAPLRGLCSKILKAPLMANLPLSPVSECTSVSPSVCLSVPWRDSSSDVQMACRSSGDR